MNDTTAAPCRICGTTGGHRAKYSTTPRRIHGFCGLCYDREVKAGRIRTKKALEHICAACGTTFYDFPSHRRVYCSIACAGVSHFNEHPDPLPAVVTPAMVGILPGQPPTDPGLTPHTVRAIANLNNTRALDWLAAHPDRATADAYASLVWRPAQAEKREAAA